MCDYIQSESTVPKQYSQFNIVISGRAGEVGRGHEDVFMIRDNQLGIQLSFPPVQGSGVVEHAQTFRGRVSRFSMAITRAPGKGLIRDVAPGPLGM